MKVSGKREALSIVVGVFTSNKVRPNAISCWCKRQQRQTPTTANSENENAFTKQLPG